MCRIIITIICNFTVILYILKVRQYITSFRTKIQPSSNSTNNINVSYVYIEQKVYEMIMSKYVKGHLWIITTTTMKILSRKQMGEIHFLLFTRLVTVLTYIVQKNDRKFFIK